MKKFRIALTALLLFAVTALTVEAFEMTDNARLRVTCFENANGVFAVLMVESQWGAFIDAEVTLSVNGQAVKVEPVQTHTAVMTHTWIALPGTAVSVCADMVGFNWITDERRLAIDQTACTVRAADIRHPATPPRLRLRDQNTSPPARLPWPGND